MSMQVLQHIDDVKKARDQLDHAGLSSLEPPFSKAIKRAAAKTRLVRPLIVGDFLKSWDVEKTVSFIEANVARDRPVLDIGAYASEVLVILDKAGYSDLTGVDLNPKLKAMPAADRIDYVAGDFLNSGLPAGKYAVVTAISVIEHGYDGDRLFSEMSRLLDQGGYFIASFDYWPDKISTDHIRMFDMSWTIFSRQDVDAMIADAARHGLVPVGDVDAKVGTRAIEHAGQKYTFGWIAFQNRA